jgi:hypothetical protein
MNEEMPSWIAGELTALRLCVVELMADARRADEDPEQSSRLCLQRLRLELGSADHRVQKDSPGSTYLSDALAAAHRALADLVDRLRRP